MLRIEITKSKVRIENNINEEPIVPKSNPPFSCAFVSRPPNVAPKGRAKTKASQNH